MDRIQIIGGKILDGKINISGSKNSALPILAATLLTDRKFTINNVPELSDIYSMIELLNSLNVKTDFKQNTFFSKASKPKTLIA